MSIFNTFVVMIQFNAVVGFVGIVASLVGMVYLWVKAAPKIRHILIS